MARPTIFQLLALILSLLYTAATADSAISKNFIKVSCNATLYPAVCVKSLSGHADAIQQSPHQLALTALAVSLTAAESTKANMLKLTKLKGLRAMEYGALKDCLDQIEDSVDRLSQSVREIEHLGRVRGEEFLWHKSNVDTWTSAALSQMDSCAEGFSGHALDGKIKASVQEQVTNVEQLISNALALFSKYLKPGI